MLWVQVEAFQDYFNASFSLNSYEFWDLCFFYTDILTIPCRLFSRILKWLLIRVNGLPFVIANSFLWREIIFKLVILKFQRSSEIFTATNMLPCHSKCRYKVGWSGWMFPRIYHRPLRNFFLHYDGLVTQLFTLNFHTTKNQTSNGSYDKFHLTL